MDVLKLNPTTYLPEALVEGYNSMIWTERYLDFGEFELRTPLISETRALIPEMSLLSIRNSREVMIVETHSISSRNGAIELVVKGRSAHCILDEGRIIEGVNNQKIQTFRIYTNLEVALAYIWNSVVNNTSEDVTMPNTYERLLGKSIPNSVVTDSTTGYTGIAKGQWIEEGRAWPFIRTHLAYSGCGLRTLRPVTDSGIVIDALTADTSDKGSLTRTWNINIPQLRWDVYNGVDRSIYQSDRTPVVFDVAAGDVDSPEYLFNFQTYKNMAVISSGVGRLELLEESEIWAQSGFGLRMLFVNAGSPADGEDVAAFIADLPNFGRAELQNNNREALFNGDISPLIPYQYGQHYFLGDLVSLRADYGINQTMLVSEYVRTEDKDGDRGYPGLLNTT